MGLMMASHTRTFAVAYTADDKADLLYAVDDALLCLGGEWVPQYSPATDKYWGLPAKVVGVTATHILVKVRASKAALRLLRYYTVQYNAMAAAGQLV
jgi:hypothetical protein